MDYIQQTEPIKVSGTVVASYGSEYHSHPQQGRRSISSAACQST
jgi:hypothetical protein